MIEGVIGVEVGVNVQLAQTRNHEGILDGAGSPTMGMATSALRVARTSVVGMLTVYGLLEFHHGHAP